MSLSWTQTSLSKAQLSLSQFHKNISQEQDRHTLTVAEMLTQSEEEEQDTVGAAEVRKVSEDGPLHSLAARGLLSESQLCKKMSEEKDRHTFAVAEMLNQLKEDLKIVPLLLE